MMWILLSLLILAVVLLGVLVWCYRFGFYSAPRKPLPPDHMELPVGEIYEAYREKMEGWIREARALLQEHFEITSFDGLKLRGIFYEYAPGAPIEIMFHGYRGCAERDLPGGVQRCFRVGRSALLVDQRGGGRSEGSTISFGINERKDCLKWIDFVIGKFGPDVKIILTGISMGAATVMMAAGEDLPENVIGILADCGYSSPKEIILKVIGEMGLPPKLSYPFARLAARLFGHFDLEETSPVEALKKCKVPVIFYHGEADAFVPCDMSRACFNACASRKKLVTIPGAGHGLSYAVAPDTYVQTLKEFFGPEASFQE